MIPHNDRQVGAVLRTVFHALISGKQRYQHVAQDSLILRHSGGTRPASRPQRGVCSSLAGHCPNRDLKQTSLSEPGWTYKSMLSMLCVTASLSIATALNCNTCCVYCSGRLLLQQTPDRSSTVHCTSRKCPPPMPLATAPNLAPSRSGGYSPRHHSPPFRPHPPLPAAFMPSSSHTKGPSRESQDRLRQSLQLAARLRRQPT